MPLLTFRHLQKISLNQWYAGNAHWSKRVKIKKDYVKAIKAQCKEVFRKEFKYKVEYDFYFKSRPLDASNCVAMVKLIEDIIFEDDGYKIVTGIKIRSHKCTDERVEVNIEQYKDSK